MKGIKRFMKMVAVTLILLLTFPAGLFAQEPTGKQAFSQGQLEQILAPVALYPDEVLAQILIAATYPIEVVQADRWVKQNSGLKGNALTSALEQQPWDPSVKSLVNFPQVLTMMSEKLDWTQNLGDAFLAQQEDVMKSVQVLRNKANASGNLKTTKEQKVIVEKETIIIQPANPQVVYIPTYNPTVVYGTWAYPAYPPAYYYPPGYVATTAFFSFAAGVAVAAAWGYAWGNCNWGHGGHYSVNYNINQNININRNINRNAYVSHYQGGRGSGTWQHNPSHRGGVAYSDRATATKYNRGASPSAVKSRENYRGRSEAVQRDLGRGGTSQRSGASQMDRSTRSGQRGSAIQMDRSMGSGQRGGSGKTYGGMSASQRSSGRSSAFSGMDRGSSARDFSSRGSQSRQSMSRSGGGGSRGGGFSGGGGGRRR
ncbi:MAG: DUF3300 domain-containing protein [Geobacteraceae bacterium]|nr:DUF3300 domain-containing protein [Geobacteraceae bacterium]